MLGDVTGEWEWSPSEQNATPEVTGIRVFSRLGGLCFWYTAKADSRGNVLGHE